MSSDAEFSFIQSVRPTSATMTAEVWERSAVWCEIQIELAEFEYHEETENGPVILGCIDFGVTDRRQLENREFEFPRNPEDGYVDGSLYLNYQYETVDLTKIVFGKATKNTIEAVLTIEFAFAVDSNEQAVEWPIQLEFDPEQLDEAFEDIREFAADPRNNRPAVDHPVLGTLAYDNVTGMYFGTIENGASSVRCGLAVRECNNVDALLQIASDITSDLRKLAASAAEFITVHSDDADASAPLILKSYVVYPGGAAVWMFLTNGTVASVTMASDRTFELLK